QRGIDREERAPFGGEPVLVELARGVPGVGPALEDPVIDEPVEPLGEDVAREADAALEVFEAARAVEGLAKDHPHPAFADDAGRARDRAVFVEQFSVLHASSLPSRAVAKRYYLGRDRKSTRLNSSHQIISYAVFCLKKKKKK